MTVSDPIADMLTRIRNAVSAGHTTVAMPSSKIKVAIAKVLKEEGYIENFQVAKGERESHRILRVRLKYVGEHRNRQPVLSGVQRVSRPGSRYYAKKRQIPRVLSGMGTAIVSTPKGVMTGRRARQLGIGGEVLCMVW